MSVKIIKARVSVTTMSVVTLWSSADGCGGRHEKRCYWAYLPTGQMKLVILVVVMAWWWRQTVDSLFVPLRQFVCCLPTLPLLQLNCRVKLKKFCKLNVVNQRSCGPCSAQTRAYVWTHIPSQQQRLARKRNHRWAGVYTNDELYKRAHWHTAAIWR